MSVKMWHGPFLRHRLHMAAADTKQLSSYRISVFDSHKCVQTTEKLGNLGPGSHADRSRQRQNRVTLNEAVVADRGTIEFMRSQPKRWSRADRAVSYLISTSCGDL